MQEGSQDRIRREVEYAYSRGAKVASDLGVRLPRGAFQRWFPNQNQWMLRLRAFEPASLKNPVVEFAPLRNYMTETGAEYGRLNGRLMDVLDASEPDLREVETGHRVDEKSPLRAPRDVSSGAPRDHLIVAADFEYRTRTPSLPF